MTNDPHRSEGRRCQAAEQQPLIILPFHSAAASIRSAAPPQPENRFASSLLSPSCIHSSSRLVPPPSATTKVLNAHPSFSFTGTPSCSTKASLRAAVVGCAAHPPQLGAAALPFGETFRSGRAFNQIVADARGRVDSGRCMGEPTGADMKEDERWDTHVGLKGELPCSRRQQLNHSRRKTTRFEQRMEAVVARERRKERREDELAATAGKPAGSLGGLQVPYDHELAHLMCDPLGALDTPHSIADECLAAERPPWVDQMHLGCHASDEPCMPATARRLSIGNHDKGREADMREAVRVSHRRARQRQQLREDERRLRLWSGADGSKGTAQGHHRVTSSSPSLALERAFDAKEASIAAAIDALMRTAFRGGWRPQRSQANAADDCCHHPSANNHGVVAPLMANVLSILPTDVVMVFDTSALISASNWVDVLELITSFGNTVVAPPTVLHELDFTIKRWRSREHAEWVARQQGDKTSGDEDAAGTAGSRTTTTTTRFRRTKRQRGDDDEERCSTDRRRDADEALAKRALVLRDWFSVVTQHQRLVNEVSDDAECDDAEAIDRLALRFAPGRVTVAQHADSVEFLCGDGRHAMPPAHNNDDRILRVAMYLAHQFVVMPAVNEAAPSSTAPARRRRPVILITDDRVMAMKARVEQITVATSLQLLNWK